jgi:hypothetical protein
MQRVRSWDVYRFQMKVTKKHGKLTLYISQIVGQLLWFACFTLAKNIAQPLLW